MNSKQIKELPSFDMTYAQALLFHGQKYVLDKAVNTLGTSFFADVDYDVELLKRAIRIAFDKQECLRMRLLKKDKKTVQCIVPYYELDIPVLDFRGKTAEYQEKKLSKLTHINITKANPNVQMFRIYIVHTHDGLHGLYMAVSHLCMDSTAIFNFYKYVYELYCALHDGTAMPRDPASYIEMTKKDLAYQGSEANKADDLFWEEFYKSRPEPYYADINGTALLEKKRKKRKDPTLHHASAMTLDCRAKHVVYTVQKDLVDRIEDFCKRKNITFQALLFAAQMTYNSALSNLDNICITLTVSRRGTLAQKSCGGSRIHCAHYYKEILPTDNFLKAATEIADDFYSVFKHFDVNPPENMYRFQSTYNTGMLDTYNSMCITHQPIRVSLPGINKIQMKWHSNRAACQALYLTVMDGNCTGDLFFYYEYLTALFTEDAIMRSHNGIMKILEKAISDDTVTSGQLRALIKQ